MSEQPTLSQLLSIESTQRQLEANKKGVLTTGQLDDVTEKYRELGREKFELNAWLAGETIAMLILGFSALNSNQFPFGLIGMMLLLTFFMVATSYYRHQKRWLFLRLQADISKPTVGSVTGIPSIEFVEGLAYVIIDDVRFPANDKYVVGYKSKTVYTVYCTPHAHIPLSYEVAAEQTHIPTALSDNFVHTEDNQQSQSAGVRKRK